MHRFFFILFLFFVSSVLLFGQPDDCKLYLAGVKEGVIEYEQLILLEKIELRKSNNVPCKHRITYFNIFVVNEKRVTEASSTSALITEDQKKILSSLADGQKVVFENIKIKDDTGFFYELGAVVFIVVRKQ